MIKARFEGDLNQMFLFSKKTDDSDNAKGKQKISILPIVVNEIKREMKRAKNENGKEGSNKDEKIDEENKQKINKIVVKNSNGKHKVDFDSYVKMQDLQNYSIDQTSSKKVEKLPSFSQKYNPFKIYSANRSLQNVSQNSTNNSLNSSSKQTSYLIKNVDNSNNSKTQMDIIFNNNPYTEKFTEKHKEYKRKLIKEKLKIFSINKNLSASNDSSIADKSDANILNGSVILMNKSPIIETMSLSESSLSDIDNLNQHASIIKKSENQRRIKKPLIKQSTIETTVSSEFY
jgi:hypothetical protein